MLTNIHYDFYSTGTLRKISVNKKKVVKKIEKRRHHNFRVFIGDQHGAKEAVILVEKLERDLTKKKRIMSTIDHITLTACV